MSTSLFERIQKGFSGKAAKKQEVDLTASKELLKKLVYDDELVDEFAPLFAKLSAHEGFDKVVELLETKEKQLESLTSVDWTKPNADDQDAESQQEDNNEDDEANGTTTAESILKAKYSTQQ